MVQSERRLKTIVALDVAGYSARVEANERRTITEVLKLRPLIEKVARKRTGRLFYTAGDGFMLAFASAHSGVEAALELARLCKPSVRVGVHLDDVFAVARGDYLGHGVNVAARLMANSEPGSVLISVDVYRRIRDGLADRFAPLGKVQLAKMRESIEVFAPVGVVATGRRRIDVKRYAKTLSERVRAESTVGQSKFIDLGYDGPMLALPANFKTVVREVAYVDTLRRIRGLNGKDPEKLYARWLAATPRAYRNDPNIIIDAPLRSLLDAAKAYPANFAIHLGIEKELGARPWSVTGNVLAVTPDGAAALIMMRNKRVSRDSPEQLHIIGGQMDPYYDLGSVALNAEREFREEAGRPCSVAGCPVVLLQEAKFRNSMVTFLGVPVEHGGSHETEEGSVFALDLTNTDAVANCFLNNEWVDSGWQAFLVWVGLGCPVRGAPSPSLSAAHVRRLYERCLEIARTKGLLAGQKNGARKGRS